MKKSFLLLFTLLCVSMMGWADPVEGSSTDNMAGQGNAFVNGYDYSFSTEGTSVTISFTEKENYTGLVAYLWNYTNGFAETGMTVSGHTASITLTGQTPGATLTFACKFAYAGGMSVTKQFTYTVENTGGGTPDPTPTKASECFGAKGHFGNPSVKNVYYQIDYENNKVIVSLLSLTGYPLDFAEIQITGVGGYAMTANGAGGYTYTFNNPTVDAEWYIRFLYSDTNMPGNEMTAESQSSSDANIIYYQVGACTATTTENTNIALSSAGASATASDGNPALAIDGNTGTRWETAASDPQWICVDFGERKKFNTVQLVHEGAYIKTYDIQISDDGTNFTTIKHVSETLAGFPYEQTIELNFDYAAQYMRIYGTERGTGWGYSLWELRAMYSGASVLTSITLAAADTKTLVGGAGVVLTATPKDQKGAAMEETVSYEITPAAAGHMSGNTYIPDQVGLATIRAYSGSIYSNAVQVLGVTSANLALSTNISTDNKIIAQSEFSPNGTNAFFAVDGDMGSVWQGSPTAGNVDNSRVYDCWFVVDLGAFYNIDMVALHFEGACSELYHIDFSEDNSTWNLGYNLVGAEGINARNDYWTALDNNLKVRYVRFWSTKSATGWGMKMYEFEVYGTEWQDTGDTEAPVMVSASLVSSTATSAVIAVNATDNVGVFKYHVVDATNSIDANYFESEGKIEITGLTHNTAYNFTITAIDAANHESENSKQVAVTTPFDVTINLALNKTCEGGYYDNNPAESADKANDGNNGTSWVTYGDHAAALDWWVVDLGAIYNLTNITALWANDAYATAYMLQARVDAPTAEDKADDAAWVTLATVSGVTAGEEKSTDVSGVGRYVRFRATANAGGFFRLREFRVYASGVATVDTEKPVMSSASLVSNTDVQAIIAVAATDNVGIANYHVVDAGNSIDGHFAPAEGQITVTGLTGGTDYTLVITAVDYFGNESENSKSVAVTTTAHYTAPQAACPVPTWDAALVKAMYSPTYSADCGLGEWGSGTSVTNDTYGKKYAVGNAYFGMVDFTLNCLMMEKVHFDIWVENDLSIRFVPIWGGAEQGITRNLVGQQWNSIDIDLTDYTGVSNWGNITQFKLDQMPTNFNLWIANAYFYREAAYVDTEAPTNVSASKVAEGFYSVSISAQAEDNSGAVNFSVMNGDTEVATGASASGVATTITVTNLTPGTAYNFNVIAKDDANNAADPVAVAATTVALPAPAPTPDLTCQTVVPVFSDAIPGSLAGGTQIHSGGWGESTIAQWINLTPSDKVFYAQNFNWAGWHSWGASLVATGMRYLHVDFYSLGMTQISVTPISPGHEGVYNVALTPNAWTSAEIPLSAFDANNIDWADIFQFKFMNPVGGNEFMVDNVYFYEVPDYFRADLTVGGIGTICLPKDVATDKRFGGTFYRADYQGPGFVYFLEETGTLKAGQAYIFVAEEEAIRLWYSGSEVLTPLDGDEARGFYGTFADMAAGSLTDKYVIANGKLRRCGAGATLSANRAYIDLTEVPTTPLVVNDPANAPVRRRLGVGGNNGAATDLENVFQLNAEGTQKLILNGQLYILRDGHLYNAQGQVIK